MFNVLEPQVCFQEVPGHIALGFVCTGCPLRCPGCHSVDTWDPKHGERLTSQRFLGLFERYKHLITCVVFFGGEWQEGDLVYFLKLATQQGLATCLYTGLEDVPEQLKAQLTYVKTGRYVAELGGLASHLTNQRFIEIASGKVLNSLFLKG